MALKKVIVLGDWLDVDKYIVIEQDDAVRYRTSLLAVLKRLDMAFFESNDLSFRKWINRHGEVLDELADELKLRK